MTDCVDPLTALRMGGFTAGQPLEDEQEKT